MWPTPRRPGRSSLWWLAGLCVVCAAAAGCGSDVRTVELVRIAPGADPACGAPTDGRTLIISALGDFPPSEATGRPVNLSEADASATFAIDSFPPGTRVIELVVIGSGGLTRTVGRTSEFDVEDLSDGDELPVFMAPPRGFCPTGDAGGTPRRRPLVARAGDDVLIAGGYGADGRAVQEVQLYDARAGAMRSLGNALYGDDVNGLDGASLTTLDDGRLVVAGGPAPAYQVYDPQERRFGVAAFLPDARAQHAAVALPGARVLLIGGCAQLDGSGGCELGRTLATTVVLDVEQGTVMSGPPLSRARRGATAFVDADGRIVVVGGVDDSGRVDVGERLDPSGARPSEEVAGAGGVGVQLADGGLLAALAPSGGVASDAAVVLPVGGVAVSSVASALGARAGATLTALEDGRVLVLGGLEAAGGIEALLYSPDQEEFEPLDAQPDLGAGTIHRRDHGAVRLADGSVLVVGGLDPDGAVLGDAWIFRPDLTGPFTSDATISFGVAAAADLSLVPRDPARFRIEPSGGGSPATAVLDSSGAGGVLPDEWALVAGPRFVDGDLDARLAVSGGGVALIMGFVDAANYSTAVLIPGQNAQLYDVVGGEVALASECQGELIEAMDLGSPGQLVDVTLGMREHAVEVTAAGRAVLRCGDREEPQRGLLGVGAIGTSGASVRVASLSIGR